MALADDLAAILQERLLKLHRDKRVALKDERSNMRVWIVGVSAPVARIRLEKVGHVPGLKGGVTGTKICDFALLAETDDTIHAVLIELKKTRTTKDGPREQLRRSLPVLEYLRSACDVERGTHVSKTMSVGYVLVFEREGARALDKQTVRPARPATEQYRNITVNTFVGAAIPFPSVMPALTSA